MRDIMKRQLKKTTSTLIAGLVLFGVSTTVRAESVINVNAIHEAALKIVKQYQNADIREAYHNMEPVFKPYYDEFGNLKLQSEGYAVIVSNVKEGKEQFRVYLDENLELKSEGLAVCKYEYDDGRLILEINCNKDGELVNGMFGYSKAECIDEGETSLKWYYDADGNKLDIGSGYLHNYLWSLKEKNYTVFISVRDEASKGMTKTIIDDMCGLGIKTSLLDKYGYSFYAVVSPNYVIEDVSLQPLEYSGSVGEMKYTIKSAGWDAGYYSSIVIDGVEYAKNRRGLNIVVYDNDSNSVIDSFAIDTYQSHMPVIR